MNKHKTSVVSVNGFL